MTITAQDSTSWLAERSSGAMSPGSVLVHAPSHAFQSPGGGENQLVQTSRHLEDLGVTIRPFSPWADRIEDARLLHLYGMSREGLELAKVARSRGVPVVVSPICWFEPRALAALAGSRSRAAMDLITWSARRILPRLPDWRRRQLDLADAILPNSHAEASQLESLFGADLRKVFVVPNGVDPRFAESDPELFRSRYGDEEFVLYVGRIEPRKNVLNLIRGVTRIRRPLVVIGEAVPGHERYFEDCRREGEANVRFLRRVDHADPLLASAMAAARVLALPSWFETPGLAALEAALAGCAIVITPYGCTREYFGDEVEYARPGDVSAIASAIASAWGRGASAKLANHVADRYPWSAVARATKEAYDRIDG